jgi:hypothetical protein
MRRASCLCMTVPNISSLSLSFYVSVSVSVSVCLSLSFPHQIRRLLMLLTLLYDGLAIISHHHYTSNNRSEYFARVLHVCQSMLSYILTNKLGAGDPVPVVLVIQSLFECNKEVSVS